MSPCRQARVADRRVSLRGRSSPIARPGSPPDSESRLQTVSAEGGGSSTRPPRGPQRRPLARWLPSRVHHAIQPCACDRSSVSPSRCLTKVRAKPGLALGRGPLGAAVSWIHLWPPGAALRSPPMEDRGDESRLFWEAEAKN